MNRDALLAAAGLSVTEGVDGDVGFLEFQAVAWSSGDEQVGVDDEDEDAQEGGDDDLEFVIRGFGATACGQSVALVVRSFRPHFYFRVEKGWTPGQTRSLKEFVTSHTRLGVLGAREVSKKDFYGFRNGHADTFVRVDCRSLKAMKIMADKLRKPVETRGIAFRAGEIKLYESNIEPLIRFMHMRDVQPVGWIRVSHKDLRAAPDSRCSAGHATDWTRVHSLRGRHDSAPFVISSFDIECSSSHGDFPTPRKDYKRLQQELQVLMSGTTTSGAAKWGEYDAKRIIERAIQQAVTHEDLGVPGVSNVYLKQPGAPLPKRMPLLVDDIYAGLLSKRQVVDPLVALNACLPEVEGDAIIQIGITFAVYGSPVQSCAAHRHIFTLGGCAEVPDATVYAFKTERELLVAWARFVAASDPDVLVGYNILGFDMEYIFVRATELRCEVELLALLSRLKCIPSTYRETKLSSSALGDNLLKVIDMPGRVVIDLMKVVQRDHKLDSYKLDSVAEHFTGQNKNDVSPADIFRLQRGSDTDRAIIAAYCVQDCELVLRLAWKLDVMANNIGMANVCTVPLTYIFMRGQGVKIFSLVAKQCKLENFLIPAAARNAAQGVGGEEEDGYEGAIVLEPQSGIYMEPVSVLDYASLYPSSMISENLSHDSIVLDKKYADVPGVEYLDIAYDLYEGSGATKVKVGERVCRFAQDLDGQKAVIPRILQDLIGQRKATRKMCEHKRLVKADGGVFIGALAANGRELTDKDTGEIHDVDEEDRVEDAYNEFQKAVLDGLQLAYKVTANSLYGALGARTNPLYLKDIAACTTATGRSLILKAKAFVQKEFGARVIYGDSVTGSTPVPVRVDGVNVVYTTAARLAAAYGGALWRACDDEPGRESKEACELSGVEAWTEAGWTRVHRVIRHRLAAHKRIVRVRTPMGVVDVTDEHSLLRPDGSCVTPMDVAHSGGPLMHAAHPAWMSQSCAALDVSTEEAQIMGMFIGCRCATSVAAVESSSAGLYFVWSRDKDVVLDYQDACAIVYPHIRWTLADVSGPLNPSLFALVPEGPHAADFCAEYNGIVKDTDSYTMPYRILAAPYDEVKLAFLSGFYTSNPKCIVSSQLTAATLYVLLDSLCTHGTVCVCVAPVTSPSKDCCYQLYWVPHDGPGGASVLGTESMPSSGIDFVYDLTTDNNHFAAGVGKLIVHNTDSIFCIFPNTDEATGEQLRGKAALSKSIQTGAMASAAFKPYLKPPHDLEYEKTFYPFIILSKKRYVGNVYERDVNEFKQKSMGIVLKRRDNANIVKQIYGGVIDIILNRQDVSASVEFLKRSLHDLIHGRCPIHDLVITKSLRSESSYKDPDRIAHLVLARRMGERDPGNRPQASDRIPYVFIVQPKAILQGDKIEHPGYVAEKKLKIDYLYYIEHQIMKPVIQLYSIVLEQLAGYAKPTNFWAQEAKKLSKAYDGDAAKVKGKVATLREKEAERLLFSWVFADPVIKRAELEAKGMRCIRDFFVKQ